MSHRRADLTNEKILEALKKFKGNVNQARQHLDCSYRLVHDVKSGKRKDPSEWTNKESHAPKDLKNPCTCCGNKEKGKGMRFLCLDCFHDEEDTCSNEHRVMDHS